MRPGSGRVSPRLSESDLFRQFELHNDRRNRIPTALVSVSDRPIEALHRAFDKYYNWGEDPSTIWIAIISVPVTHCGEKPYHHAQELADGDDRLKHEYLFEWKIPKQTVKHTVSVETLTSTVDARSHLFFTQIFSYMRYWATGEALQHTLQMISLMVACKSIPDAFDPKSSRVR